MCDHQAAWSGVVTERVTAGVRDVVDGGDGGVINRPNRSDIAAGYMFSVAKKSEK